MEKAIEALEDPSVRRYFEEEAERERREEEEKIRMDRSEKRMRQQIWRENQKQHAG